MQPMQLESVRSDRLVYYVGYAALGVTIACVAGMSWHGLTGFAVDVLHLTGPARCAVPLSLDGAGMACSTLALRATIARDAAAGPRVLLWVFVAASAVANGYHAERTTGVAAALFFSGMSLASTALFEVVLRQLRRAALRDVEAIEDPLPRFRLLRWIRFPAETASAWSLALRFGLSRPSDALVLHWEHTGQFTPHKVESTPDPQAVLVQQLRSATKAEALRIAFEEIGSLDVMAALEWLEDHNITPPSRTYAFVVKKELQTEASAEAQVRELEAAR